ncbi:sigma-54-dependent transcriptional regulator [Aquabacterium sp.]|uniref:sigma-54-dependent transcriptional regulator n=1 Tax=Aquabacterium sp. TaxID=1872578 RepID=UPI002BE32A9B|nr:sigma-54 dependent transcriptional regulator [Aquabacterium sp.]HSW06127.1 sigma-54 dependent transcriptional regulator [Aquabacterium sp.]
MTQAAQTVSPSLLVVDDEPDLRTLYELTLLREGYDVETAGSVEEAWQRMSERSYSAVISDMRLPDGSGLDLLRRIEASGRPEKTIVITAYGSAENAVEALKAGAFDYLTKPVDLRQFRGVVASALGRAPGAPTVRPGNLPSAAVAAGSVAPPVPPGAPLAPAAAARAAPVAEMHAALKRLVGSSTAMQQVRSMIERVARGMAPVMVQGESGTGKELVARAIHGVSGRATQAFIAVNCGAIPEQLLEAEFFGYRKGAFTGANEDREGFFQAANGGTLFLDELGDLPLTMQSKLLRAIQERSVRQIGAVSEMPVNVRIVSATHKDLATEVHEGRFRQDLYYRLNVIQLRMPPLRERIDDLPAICDAVLARISRDAGVATPPHLSADALRHLAGYGFPGNVRELENLLHRAVTMSSSGDVIESEDLGLADDLSSESEWAALEPAAGVVAEAPLTPIPVSAAPLPTDLVAYLDQVERDILVRVLERHRFNRTAAGASMGLSLRQMRYRMARLGINVADHGGD